MEEVLSQPIPGFSSYLIYTDGRIFSLPRPGWLSGGFLKIPLNKNGYPLVSLSLGKKGSKKSFLVHRIVAQVYIPNPDNLPQVNHKDGNKQNNDVSNLEWCDNSHNMLHAHRTRLINMPRGPDSKLATLSREDVEYIRTSNESISSLARKFNRGQTTIKRVIDRVTYANV